MDRPAPPSPQQRDIVYCHQCENEWYRDEHGMTPCPECRGEFTEIIEEGHDPRDDEEEPDFADVPDPDEEDVDHFEWRNNGPGQPPGAHLHGTITRNITVTGQPIGQAGQAGGLAGGLMGLLGSALQTAIGGQLRQAPSPQPQDQQEGGNTPDYARNPGGYYVHTATGPNFSYTIRSNVNLTPRDANSPQPFQTNPENLDRMMASMLMNIGAQPRGPGAFQFGPPGAQFGAAGDNGTANAPAGPFADIFRLFGIPRNGVHGDAVYSQEALDRIISQLMEQHQTGNAPGPASEHAIDSLPTKAIEPADLDEQGKADCTICMDAVPLGAPVTVLPCGHWFHFDCIKSWLIEHDTCPHCRQGIMPKGEQPADRAREPSQPPLNDAHSPQYHRPSMPGGFPSPAAEASHPQSPEYAPQGSERPTSSSGGLFNRMRDTFGGGGGSGNDPR